MLLVVLYWPIFIFYISSLIIRGGNQDDAVLCTPDKTYEIKAADTSNALLLVPQCYTAKDPGNHDKLSFDPDGGQLP